MEENKNKPKIFQTIEPEKSVRVLDTGSEKMNLDVKNCLTEEGYDVRFLENVKIQYFNIIFSDKLDICRKIMTIYALIVNLHHSESFLKQKGAEVLAFYMAMGYSQSTKDMIVKALETNIRNLNQINAELTRKKFLVRDPYNTQKRSLCQELQRLRDFFLDAGQESSFNIRFRKRTDEMNKGFEIVSD